MSTIVSILTPPYEHSFFSDFHICLAPLIWGIPSSQPIDIDNPKGPAPTPQCVALWLILPAESRLEESNGSWVFKSFSLLVIGGNLRFVLTFSPYFYWNWEAMQLLWSFSIHKQGRSCNPDSWMTWAKELRANIFLLENWGNDFCARSCFRICPFCENENILIQWWLSNLRRAQLRTALYLNLPDAPSLPGHL